MRIRRFTLGLSVAASLCAGSGLSAQAPAADPFSGIVRGGWNNIKRLVSASAAKMPDVEYGFKPTPDVRSFGQIIGHLINEHYAICASANGEASPVNEDFEKRTAKADLVKAFDQSIAYCDAAYAATTDKTALQPVKLFDRDSSRLNALTVNVTHDSEHYGNLVTYLRLKGIVPPSSAGTP